MAIDLSVLLGGSVSTATVSPLAMFKKLQKLAEENKAEHASDSAAEQAKSVVREFNNAAIRLRNSQYKQSNAQVQNDVTYFRSEEHTSELQSLMRISYAVFCLKKTNKHSHHTERLNY